MLKVVSFFIVILAMVVSASAQNPGPTNPFRFNLNSWNDLLQISTPTIYPDSLHLRMYAKTGSTICIINNLGSETCFGSGGSGGSPAGSSTQVQYNASSSFGASANLTFTSPILTVGASGTAGKFQVYNNTAYTNWGSAATTSNTILGPATVFTNGDIPYFAVSSTVGTITDSGILYSTVAIGPGSSTSSHIAEFNGTDGVTLKDGGLFSLANITATFSLPLSLSSSTLSCPTCVVATANPSEGLLRVAGSTQTATGAELSGDAITSGSNAVTVKAINGTALSGLATGMLFNTTSTGVPSVWGDFTFSSHTGSMGASGIMDLHAATGTAAFKVPSNSSNTATAAGVIDFDTTASNFHAYANGADSIIAASATSLSPTNGHCIDWVVSSGNILLGDAGAACGSGGGISFPQTVSGTTHSGGIPYFNNATVLSSSLALGQYGMVYGGGAGAAPATATAPSTFNIPYFWETIPSGNASTAPQALVAGVPVDTQSSSTPAVGGDNATSAPAPDRANVILTSNSTTSTATSIGAAAGSTNFGSNFVFSLINTGSVVNTLTPTTSTFNGNSTVKLVGCVSGHNCEQLFGYSDGTNWWGGEIPPTDANGRLGCEGFMALTGDVTNTAGACATTVGKINGGSVQASVAVAATNSSGQFTAATPHQVALPLQCADTSSSSTTYTCTTSPTLAGLTTGDAFIFTSINQNNSGSSTLNIDSIGAKTIKKWQNTTNLASGDLQANGAILLTYDGTYLEATSIGNAPAAGGSVTSVATNSPLTGGTITTTGTIGCATCVTSAASLTAGGIMYGAALQASAATSAGTAKQIVLSGGSGAPTMIDFPDVKIIPAANCVSSTAGAGWNTTLTPACIGGSNNLGGYLPFLDNSVAQFEYELPADWDTANQPYVAVHFLSNSNTSGTVIFQAAVSCYKSDGSTTSDPTFNTADVMTTKTMATATRGWSTSVQSTQVTSGNSCVPGGTMLVKITRNTDTASAAVWVTKAVITTPRLLTVQAN